MCWCSIFTQCLFFPVDLQERHKKLHTLWNALGNIGYEIVDDSARYCCYLHLSWGESLLVTHGWRTLGASCKVIPALTTSIVNLYIELDVIRISACIALSVFATSQVIYILTQGKPDKDVVACMANSIHNTIKGFYTGPICKAFTVKWIVCRLSWTPHHPLAEWLQEMHFGFHQ